jgi:hypothetical protein
MVVEAAAPDPALQFRHDLPGLSGRSLKSAIAASRSAVTSYDCVANSCGTPTSSARAVYWSPHHPRDVGVAELRPSQAYISDQANSGLPFTFRNGRHGRSGQRPFAITTRENHHPFGVSVFLAERAASFARNT